MALNLFIIFSIFSEEYPLNYLLHKYSSTVSPIAYKSTLHLIVRANPTLKAIAQKRKQSSVVIREGQQTLKPQKLRAKEINSICFASQKIWNRY